MYIKFTKANAPSAMWRFARKEGRPGSLVDVENEHVRASLISSTALCPQFGPGHLGFPLLVVLRSITGGPMLIPRRHEATV